MARLSSPGIYFSKDETPAFGAKEEGRALIVFFVNEDGRENYALPRIYCATPEQVRAFVPAFVSSDEQAAIEATEEATDALCEEHGGVNTPEGCAVCEAVTA